MAKAHLAGGPAHLTREVECPESVLRVPVLSVMTTVAAIVAAGVPATDVARHARARCRWPKAIHVVHGMQSATLPVLPGKVQHFGTHGVTLGPEGVVFATTTTTPNGNQLYGFHNEGAGNRTTFLQGKTTVKAGGPCFAGERGGQATFHPHALATTPAWMATVPPKTQANHGATSEGLDEARPARRQKSG